jgi:hypothetical protein
MSRNLKILAPVVVALAMTISGTALAGSVNSADAYDRALYGQPDPFAAVQAPADNTDWASAGDQRIHKELQQANRAASSGVDWKTLFPAARGDAGYGEVHEPE